MTTRSPRAWGGSTALFVAILVCGALPWPGLRQGFNSVFRGGGNALLAAFTFGKGGHASLAPLDATRNAAAKDSPPIQQHVAADTLLALRVDGRVGTVGLGLNLRREVYMPLVLFVAVVLAAPMRARAKFRAVMVGTPVVLLIAFGCIWCLALYTFAFNVRGVLQLDAVGGLVVDLVYRGVLLPPGNRFIAPLAMGLGVVALEFVRQPNVPGARCTISDRPA